MNPPLDAHRLAEERSLEYHRRVAELLRRDPALRDRARRYLDRWMEGGGRSIPYAVRWRELLDGRLDDLLARLTDPAEDARALRQASPFAGFLDPRERWRIWREVRARLEGAA